MSISPVHLSQLLQLNLLRHDDSSGSIAFLTREILRRFPARSEPRTATLWRAFGSLFLPSLAHSFTYMSVPNEGVIVALWTPTNADGSVHEAGVKSNLEFLRDKGITGYMLLGSTGEFARLDLENRLRLLTLVRPFTSGGPTVVNASAIRPADVVSVGRHARALGFGSVALLAPWFYPLAQEDLAEFFVQCANEIGLPLFLYNFPERTGNRIDLRTVSAVADRAVLAGVKQSGDEFDYHRELIELARKKNFALFTGGEPRMPEALALGARGCVSGLANAVPELVVALYQAAKKGNPKETAVAKSQIEEVVRQMASLAFPLNVAAVMAARGLVIGEPKTPLSASTHALFRQAVDGLRQCYRAWGLA